jgi:hypothetical protein
MNDWKGDLRDVVGGLRGTKIWVILSRFKTIVYVARATTGVTIAREERLKRESLMLQNDFND